MRKRFLSWVLLAGVLLGTSSVVGVVVKAVVEPRQYDYWSRTAGVPTRMSSTAPRADLVSAAPTAFGPPEPLTPGDTTVFESVFAGVAAAAGQGNNPWLLQQHFDFDRMAEELAPLGVYRAVNRVPTSVSVADDAQTLQASVSNLFSRPDQPFASAPPRLLGVAWSPTRTEAVLVARHLVFSPGGQRVEYRRWWVKMSPGGSRFGAGWRVYDFDEPGSRLRFTVMSSCVLANRANSPTPGGGPPVVLNTPNGLIMIGDEDDEGVRAVRGALAAAVDGDREAAKAKLEEARRWSMLAPLAAVRTVAEGRLDLLDGKPDVALARFNAALQAWADTPAAHLGRAAALTDLKRHADALAAVETFRLAAGNDPEAYRQAARAHLGAGDRKAADAALRAGLQEFPGAAGLLVERFRRSDPQSRGEVGELAATAPAPGETLSRLLRAVEADDPTAAGAAAVVAGFRTLRKNEPAGLIEEAVVKVRLRKPAAEALKAGLAGLADDDQRLKAMKEFARAVARFDRTAEGYEAAAAAGQAAAAFRPLADEALRGAPGKAAADHLRAMIAAHAAAHPADPWPNYYAAELDTAAGAAGAADRQLAEGMKKLTAPRRAGRLPAAAADGDAGEKDWAAFRAKRVACLFKLGQWKKAYDELPPKVDTFDQLVRLLSEAGNATDLLALAEAHLKAAPGDAAAIAARGEAHWLKKEYAAVLKDCQEFGQHASDEPVPARVADRWVRSLIRLHRPAEARTMADAVAFDFDGILLRTLVAAANDDVSATSRNLADLMRQGRPWSAVMADPDLGPLLRSEQFSGLRQKYEPKAKK